jgi:hypothetical protein
VKAAALLIVLLSNDGYWLGGHSANVRFEPAPLAPAGRVSWVLGFGDVRIASDSLDITPGRTSTIRLALPSVRLRTRLRLAYEVSDVAGKRIDAGEVVVQLFPDNLLRNAGSDLGRARLLVWGEEADALPTLLTRAGVPHRAVAGETTLRLLRPDVVLIPPGSMDSVRPEFRPALEALADGGASVIVFRQGGIKRIADYPLAARVASTPLRWRSDDPLLGSFSQEDLASLVPPGSREMAIRLAPGDPSLKLAWWPPPSEVSLPNGEALDAMLVVRAIGKGRLVLCQLPFGEWASDPRAQMFLCAALEYAVAPINPGGGPNERKKNVPNDESKLLKRSNLSPARGQS